MNLTIVNVLSKGIFKYFTVGVHTLVLKYIHERYLILVGIQPDILQKSYIIFTHNAASEADFRLGMRTNDTLL